MDIQDVITLVLGVGNFGQTFIIFRGWKSQERKDKALANLEEGNSVVKTQEIYDKLTDVLNREVDKMNYKLKQQDILLDTQSSQIQTLVKQVDDYRTKCSKCSNNDTK